MDNNTMENTLNYRTSQDKGKLVRDTMNNVSEALTEKGYNPANQIVGYLMSGDPTYITSYKDARSNIKKIDRDDLLEEIINFYLSKAE